MGKKFKPIYVCDVCGKEFENPDEVRLFKGDVLNGEESVLYVNTRKHAMSCIECLPKLLIENYEIVQQPIQQSAPQIEPESIPQQQAFAEPEPKQSHETETIEQKVESIINEIDELVQPFEETPESPPVPKIELPATGKYILLIRISDQDALDYAAKEYGYKDGKQLTEIAGRSLINVYVPTDHYFNELPVETQETKTVEVINKFLFGIPNIVKRNVYILDDTYACIDRESFELQIDNAPFSQETQKDINEDRKLISEIGSLFAEEDEDEDLVGVDDDEF